MPTQPVLKPIVPPVLSLKPFANYLMSQLGCCCAGNNITSKGKENKEMNDGNPVNEKPASFPGYLYTKSQTSDTGTVPVIKLTVTVFIVAVANSRVENKIKVEII